MEDQMCSLRELGICDGQSLMASRYGRTRICPCLDEGRDQERNEWQSFKSLANDRSKARRL